jgi:hypothetical protein
VLRSGAISKVKGLFADDHIPDSTVPEQELLSHYGRILQERFPEANDSWRDRAARGYPAMLQAVKGLRDDDLQVACANTRDEAKRLVQSEVFDVAVVDLGWYLDASIEPGLRASAGWEILSEINTADAKLQRRTACILYSSRLVDDPRIVPQAAQRGLLPVLKYIEGNKSPCDVAVDSLRAAVNYLRAKIEIDRASPSAERLRRLHDIEDRLNAAADSSLRTLGWASAVVITAFAASLALIVVGLVFALAGKVQVGLVTSIAGTIITVFSQLTRPLFDKAQTNVETTKNELIAEMNELRMVSNAAIASS